MGKRARKTGLTVREWRMKFKEAVEYCKTHKAPGERIQDCVRKYLTAHR